MKELELVTDEQAAGYITLLGDSEGIEIDFGSLFHRSNAYLDKKQVEQLHLFLKEVLADMEQEDQ